MDTNEFEESVRIDKLVARTKVLEPGRRMAKLTPEQLSSLANSAKLWEDSAPEVRNNGRARSSRRLRYVSVGTLAAASAVATAVLLTIGSAAPLTSTKPSTGTKSSLPSPVVMIQPQLHGFPSFTSYDYEFTANASIPSSSGMGTAYELSSPSDVRSLAGKVESALGLSGPDANGPSDYLAGPSGGPDVTVGLENGVVKWQYPTWADQSAGVSVPVNQGSPVPMDDQAATKALSDLQSMGVRETQLGSPEVARSSSAVSVTFPVVVDGLSTGSYDQIVFGPGGAVIDSSGMIATATPSASYPTISAAQAVALLTGNSLISASGITTEDGSDIVNVGIDGAAPALSTYVLTDGTSWLLPTWKLSGTETGSSGSMLTGDVLAVQPQYVQLERR
jgi:hypothetical protein